MNLRDELVRVALEWEREFGVAPSITSTLSEFDASQIVGMPLSDYSSFMARRTSVSKGYDFIWAGVRYQVKANRPSSKPGSKVTMVPKAKNYSWDKLIWILYDTDYRIVEAWLWDVDSYIREFDQKKRLSPSDYRKGIRLVQKQDNEASISDNPEGEMSDLFPFQLEFLIDQYSSYSGVNNKMLGYEIKANNPNRLEYRLVMGFGLDIKKTYGEYKTLPAELHNAAIRAYRSLLDNENQNKILSLDKENMESYSTAPKSYSIIIKIAGSTEFQWKSSSDWFSVKQEPYGIKECNTLYHKLNEL